MKTQSKDLMKDKKANARKKNALTAVSLILALVLIAAAGCTKNGGEDVVIAEPTDVVTAGPADVPTDDAAATEAGGTDAPTGPAFTDQPATDVVPEETQTPDASEALTPETSPDMTEAPSEIPGTDIPEPTPDVTVDPSETPGPAGTPVPSQTPGKTPTPATPTKAPSPTPTKKPDPTPTQPPVTYNEPNNIFRSWDNDTVAVFKTTATKQTDVTLTSEGVKFTYTAKVGADPYAYLDISKYVQITGKTPLAGRQGSYVVFKVRPDGNTDGNYEIFTQNPKSGDSCTASYFANNEWQYIVTDMTGTTLVKPETLTKLRIDWSGISTKPGATMILSEIAFYSDYNEALTAAGLGQYILKERGGLSDNDSLAAKKLTAPDEDPSIKLWFDHTTERVSRNTTAAGDRTGYTVRMAKNEAENAQFFVAPGRAMKVRVVVDEFSDGKGNKVDFELAYEWYHNIHGIFQPDALIPYTGPVDVAAGNSQGFVIRLTTLPGTVAGTYNSVIHIFDDDTGKEVKRASVAVKVWDFALSEESALRTAFALWPDYIYNSYNHDKYPVDYLRSQDIEGIYYDFFLKYRVTLMDMPHGITSGYGSNKMKNPRVTSARWHNYDMSIKDDMDGTWPGWMDKVIYYPGDVDEPGARNNISTDMANLLKYANRIKANTPQYRMVIPMDRNLDLTSSGGAASFATSDTDMIGYMQQAVNIWCVKPDAFTPRQLMFVSGSSSLQSMQQDLRYGTFPERMKARVAAGDELWTYVAINPMKPYVNWQMTSDLTEPLMTMWQLKQNNVTGLLYWAVDYWKVNYWGTTPWTQDGDGMLVYSGYSFDLLEPIPGMRLEAIRDGIEDYQMLCMLEEKLGADAVNDIITRITTSVVTYTHDDDYIHAVRVLLGDTLERALG